MPGFRLIVLLCLLSNVLLGFVCMKIAPAWRALGFVIGLVLGPIGILIAIMLRFRKPDA